MSDKIDTHIKPLIDKFNVLGLKTVYSCSGISLDHHPLDYEKNPYITFEVPFNDLISEKIIRYLFDKIDGKCFLEYRIQNNGEGVCLTKYLKANLMNNRVATKNDEFIYSYSSMRESEKVRRQQMDFHNARKYVHQLKYMDPIILDKIGFLTYACCEMLPRILENNNIPQDIINIDINLFEKEIKHGIYINFSNSTKDYSIKGFVTQDEIEYIYNTGVIPRGIEILSNSYKLEHLRSDIVYDPELAYDLQDVI